MSVPSVGHHRNRRNAHDHQVYPYHFDLFHHQIDVQQTTLSSHFSPCHVIETRHHCVDQHPERRPFETS